MAKQFVKLDATDEVLQPSDITALEATVAGHTTSIAAKRDKTDRVWQMGTWSGSEIEHIKTEQSTGEPVLSHVAGGYIFVYYKNHDVESVNAVAQIYADNAYSRWSSAEDANNATSGYYTIYSGAEGDTTRTPVNLALDTEIPTSLKNPNALTVTKVDAAGATTTETYDGSAAKALTVVTEHQSLDAKQDKVYTLTPTFTPTTVTLTASGGASITLDVEYSDLTLSDGDWTCTALMTNEEQGVSEEATFSTSDGGHSASETAVDFGTQSVSIVINEVTYSGSIRIQATRTPSYCGAAADAAPVEGSNKLVTSGGVYAAVERKQDALTEGTGISIAADGTISTDAVRSFSAVGGQTPTVANGVADLSTLFTSANASLNAAVAAKVQSICSDLDPNTSSIADIINALKGNN